MYDNALGYPYLNDQPYCEEVLIMVQHARET